MSALLRRISAEISVAEWVAVCPASDRIDVARVATGAAMPRVLEMTSYQRSGEPGEALRRIGRSHGLRRARCTTLLAAADYQLLQMEIPAAAESATSLREVFRDKLRETLDQPLEHVGFDVVRIPTRALAPGRAELAYVIVAGNAVIAPRVQSFHTAGIGLSVIDVPEMAQRNIAAFCETPGRALAMLSFDDSGGLLTFTSGGELYMSRHIEIGVQQLQTDDPDRRATLFDRIGLELQRSLDNFDRQFGFLPIARLLLGPLADATRLQDYLRDYLGIGIDLLDLGDVMDITKVPELRRPERQAQCLLALGAALRQDSAA